jgi:hypothetical protein
MRLESRWVLEMDDVWGRKTAEVDGVLKSSIFG